MESTVLPLLRFFFNNICDATAHKGPKVGFCDFELLEFHHYDSTIIFFLYFDSISLYPICILYPYSLVKFLLKFIYLGNYFSNENKAFFQ